MATSQKHSIKILDLQKEVEKLVEKNRQLNEALNQKDATCQLQYARLTKLEEDTMLLRTELAQANADRDLALHNKDAAVIQKTYCEGVIKGKDDMIEALTKLVTPR